MNEINDKDLIRHKAVGHQEGDFLIFSCPLCKGYIRKLNWRTGKMVQVENPEGILHTGNVAPFDTKNIDILNN